MGGDFVAPVARLPACAASSLQPPPLRASATSLPTAYCLLPTAYCIPLWADFSLAFPSRETKIIRQADCLRRNT
jgi:hypothetical protein